MSETESSPPTAALSPAPSTAPVGPPRFDSMLDLRCVLTAWLGTTTITVRACLALREGSVVPLREMAGEDLHLQANGVDVAHGEVVIVENSTAIRVNRMAVDTARP